MQTIKMETACLFAIWLNDNAYYDMFQDIDNNGKTWCQEDGELKSVHTAEKYTILELFEIFKEQLNK